MFNGRFGSFCETCGVDDVYVVVGVDVEAP